MAFEWSSKVACRWRRARRLWTDTSRSRTSAVLDIIDEHGMMARLAEDSSHMPGSGMNESGRAAKSMLTRLTTKDHASRCRALQERKYAVHHISRHSGQTISIRTGTTWSSNSTQDLRHLQHVLSRKRGGGDAGTTQYPASSTPETQKASSDLRNSSDVLCTQLHTFALSRAVTLPSGPSR